MARLTFFAHQRVQVALKREFHYIFAEIKYPGTPEINMHTIESDTSKIGNAIFTPIEVMHYRLPVLGFRINDFTYITDAKNHFGQGKRKNKRNKNSCGKRAAKTNTPITPHF